jgi:hypothetical protein
VRASGRREREPGKQGHECGPKPTKTIDLPHVCSFDRGSFREQSCSDERVAFPVESSDRGGKPNETGQAALGRERIGARLYDKP